MNPSPATHGLAVDVGQTGTRVHRLGRGTDDRLHIPITASRTSEVTIARLGEALAEHTQPGDAIEMSVSGLRASSDDLEAVRDLADRCGATRVGATWDAEASHLGVFQGRHGTCTIWGTGLVAVAVGHQGPVSVGGHGFFLGDEGGGSWIGHQGVRCAVRMIEEHAPTTRLTDGFLTRFSSIEDADRQLQAADSPVSLLAGFAKQVIEAAAQGDQDAGSIVHRAAEYVSGAYRLAQRLAGDVEGRVVLTGGVARQHSHQLAAVERLAGLAPGTIGVEQDASMLGAKFLLSGTATEWTPTRRVEWKK